MKYGRVVDLRQPSFSSRTLSELRLRSAALLPQSPPLFLRQHLFFGEMYLICVLARKTGSSLPIPLSFLLDQLNFVRGVQDIKR